MDFSMCYRYWEVCVVRMATNKCLQKLVAQETSIMERVGEWIGEWLNEWSEYGGKNDREEWKAK